MKNSRILKKIVLLIAALNLSAFIFANPTPVENLYEYKLDNGLTLFVHENHNVPLTYVEVAVKAGASYQTPETAGLFHLYEHMMFKGNEKYQSAQSFNQELSRLGCSSWNGGTSWDYVDYYFTIPSDLTREGLEFWSYAIRKPNLDAAELENEKKVVLSEITADENNPSAIGNNYVLLNLFPEQPYRADAGGSPEVVQNCTVEQLKKIQKEFYIPSNTAIFIGGDVNPSEVLEMVKSIFGDWQNSGDKPENLAQQNKNPVTQGKTAVNVNSQISNGLILVDIYFRAPDAEFELNDTYASDYLLELLSDPEGIYAKSLTSNKKLSVPSSQYVDAGFITTKCNGFYDFQVLLVDDGKDPYEEAEIIKTQLKTKILPQIAKNSAFYSPEKKAEIENKLNYTDIYAQQKSSMLFSTIRSYWTSCSSDYFYNYTDSITSVSQKDVEYIVNKYFQNEGLICINMNGETFSKHLSQMNSDSEKYNFEMISKENSCWYNNKYETKKGNAVSSSFIKKNTAKPVSKNLLPSENKKSEIKELSLKNGIKVYVLNNGSGVCSVEIAAKDPMKISSTEIPGLESALFEVMNASSKKYPYAKKQSISYKTNTSFANSTGSYASVLEMTTQDTNFYSMLDVLTDSFLNPDFNQQALNDLQQEIYSTVNGFKTVPTSALIYNIQQTVYKNHPMLNNCGVNLDSYQKITKEAMMKLYKEIISNREIFVVAAGNIDETQLISQLNKTLGSIKYSVSENKQNETFDMLSFENHEDYVTVMEEAKGTGFVARVFPVPSYTSDEIIPCIIASKIYSDVMFNVVREHHGICYTPYSTVRNNPCGFGMEILYRVTDFDNFKEAMEESRNYMKEGKLIENISDDKKSFVFCNLDSRLEGYKNSFITGTYSGSETTSGKVNQITWNLINYGDYDYSSKDVEKIKTVTSDDILNVFNKYWVNQNALWFIVK